jgi:hypothetical protein
MGERLGEVVGDQLGAVGDTIASEGLDPSGGCPVPAGAAGPRDLRICHVADEPVPEAEFGLVLHRRQPHGADQLLALELGQTVPDLLLADAPHGGERSQPEHLAEHSGVLKQRLVLRGEGVEAGGDQGLDRVGQGQVLHHQRPAWRLLPSVVRLQDGRLGFYDLAEGPEADGVAKERQRPWRQATSSGWASTWVASSRTSRLLPTPGSPSTVTSRTACSVNACR